MGQSSSRGGGGGGGQGTHRRKAPPAATRFNKRQRPKTATEADNAAKCNKLPNVTPRVNCKLRLLRQSRVNDFLILEEELIRRSKINKEPDLQMTLQKQQMHQMCGSPMGLGSVEELPDDDHAIIKLEGSGRSWYIPMLTMVDKDEMVLNATVLCKMAQGSRFTPLAVVGVLAMDADVQTDGLKMDKAPTETFEDIGGCEQAIEELRESVETPLTNPELYEEMGIRPPCGVILYGPPGTGKTLMAKAVANRTSATFIRCVGSQLIQKHSGDGPKIVRQMFQLARDNAPSIVFFDEIDAIGTKRNDTTSAGEREVQRTMLELLNQLDGFESRGDVKVIMATNRIDTLDPALIRPGRIDRKIEIPLPDEKTKQRIFEIHTRRMTLAADVTYDTVFQRDDAMTGADLKAICTEAGMHALRERRKMASLADFKNGVEKVLMRKKEPFEALYL